jgi:hypothetical protein
MWRPMRTELINENGTKVVRLEIGAHRSNLSASDVDAFIEHLGALRAAMKPAVPGRMSREQRYSVEVDPCWYVEPHPSLEGLVVFLRDSGLGWAGFAINRTSVRELCDELSDYTAATVKPPALPN